MNDIDKNKLSAVTSKLYDSYIELLQLWYSNDNIHDFLNEEYPFTQSFDEMGLDTWLLEIKRRIKNV